MSASNCRVRTASSSSSSTSRTRTDVWIKPAPSGRLGLPRGRRKLHDLEPITTQRLHHRHQPVEGDRLGDEAVYTQIIAPVNVLFRFGSRENDDRDVPQIRVTFDFAQG